MGPMIRPSGLALPISTAQKQTKVSGQPTRMSTTATDNHKFRPARSLWSANLTPANGALGAGEAKATRDRVACE
ncbi:hypothetical protein LA080_009741 [Diaporthe eres]|nr:hypothetical protein LA080_009741 [Diaporthe eres]